MKTYDKEHLQQCVRNLFAQAKYEFRTVHNIESRFGNISEAGIVKAKVFSLWENSEDSFYATAFELIKRDGSTTIMINFSVYVKYSDYTCSLALTLCETPDDVFAWLQNPVSMQECLEHVDQMVDGISFNGYFGI